MCKEVRHKTSLLVLGCICLIIIWIWLSRPWFLHVSKQILVTSANGTIRATFSSKGESPGTFRQMYVFMVLKFGFYRKDFSLASQYTVVFPYWLIICVLIICIWRQWEIYRRIRSWRVHGYCTACGYDIRGITGRCPECGVQHLDVRSFRCAD